MVEYAVVEVELCPSVGRCTCFQLISNFLPYHYIKMFCISRSFIRLELDRWNCVCATFYMVRFCLFSSWNCRLSLLHSSYLSVISVQSVCVERQFDIKSFPMVQSKPSDLFKLFERVCMCVRSKLYLRIKLWPTKKDKLFFPIIGDLSVYPVPILSKRKIHEHTKYPHNLSPFI